MMLYQSGDALLRNSIRISLGATRSLLKTSWTHASRNAESLIKLARQEHYGRRDGCLDHQFRRLGDCRHFQGFRTVDTRDGRTYRDLHQRVSPALHGQAAADRTSIRPAL